MINEDYYETLAKKLDSTIQGLSPINNPGKISKTWIEYLQLLVPPEDIQYLIELPVFPNVMSVKKFAKRINKSEIEANEILERLFVNDCVMRIGATTKKYGIHLPFLIFDVPPLSYDKMPKEKAEKLAKLSYKYLVDEEWYRNFEGSPETPLSRIIPVQESLPFEQNIIPYEDVEEIIDNAKILSLQECACRKRLDFLGIRKCQYPLESCIGVNQGARFFIDRGHGRKISKDEAKKLLKELNKMGLVHTTENFKEGKHTLICSCCSCCCNLIGGITRWDNPRAVAKANYVAEIINIDECSGCETCANNCNFGAITISDNLPTINTNKCMGCGVCVVNCPLEIIQLKRVEREHIYKNLIELGLKVAKESNRELKLF
ncbi:MAG: ATP-binding protein [Candidatus Helarchaeota archaeon]